MERTPCTISSSINVVRNCLSTRAIDIVSANIFDGCGLSPHDGMSAHSFVSLLQYMNFSSNREVFMSSLPAAGKSGSTIASWLLKTPLEGRIYAKSGTTSVVKSYTGYIYAENGDIWAFSIIVNNQVGKTNGVKGTIGRFLNEFYAEQQKKN